MNCSLSILFTKKVIIQKLFSTFSNSFVIVDKIYIIKENHLIEPNKNNPVSTMSSIKEFTYNKFLYQLWEGPFLSDTSMNTFHLPTMGGG
jgi:hypothetical protein